METNRNEWDDNETILNNFKNLPNKDTDSIIRFLSFCNAKLIYKISAKSVTEELKEEIIEFFNYFIDNYEQQTRKARLSNWPNDALIIRTGYEYAIEKELVKIKGEIEKFPYEIQDEAEELRDIIFKIRNGKTIAMSFSNGDLVTLQIPALIQKGYLETFKCQVMYYFCLLINGGGSATVRISDGKDRFTIFGVLCNNGKWEPITKETMMRSYSFDGYGRPLKPEKGVTFIQISKPVHYTA